MLSTSRVKYLRSLHVKKYRVAEQQCIIEGHRLINEALNAKTEMSQVWCTQSYADKHDTLIDSLQQQNVPVDITTEKSLSQVCDSQHNQGIIALMPIPQFTSFQINDKPILILDNVSDPGNMGTLMRTAEWFGIENIILSLDCVDPYNSKVIRSGMGAHFYLSQLAQLDLLELMPTLKSYNYHIMGADMEGTSVDSITSPEQWALVLGSEAHGLSPHIMPFIDEKVTIPQKGHINSLNVAVAGGVIMGKLVALTSY